MPTSSPTSTPGTCAATGGRRSRSARSREVAEAADAPGRRVRRCRRLTGAASSRPRSSAGSGGAGFRALWAGGCVRDLLLGLTPADYDVATAATPEQVMRPLRADRPGRHLFGVVRVLGPHGSGIEVEVATFRSDGAYVDGRRPESVTFSTPEARRRPPRFHHQRHVPRPLHGRGHRLRRRPGRPRRRILRAIGDPAARFAEDKLRLLRAVRFAARFGFAIEPHRAALRAMADQVVVAAERIAQELRRMLVHDVARGHGPGPGEGLVAAVLPPLVRMKGVFQGKPVQPQGDLWDHTMLVLQLLPAGTSFPLAFAALLHDVGKPETLRSKEGRTLPQPRARRPADRRPALPPAEALQRRARAGHLARRFAPVPRRATSLRESKLKRLLAGPGIEELLALHRADALANTGTPATSTTARPICATSPPGRSTRRRWSPATTWCATASTRRPLRQAPRTGPRGPARAGRDQQAGSPGMAGPPGIRLASRPPHAGPGQNDSDLDDRA